MLYSEGDSICGINYTGWFSVFGPIISFWVSNSASDSAPAAGRRDDVDVHTYCTSSQCFGFCVFVLFVSLLLRCPRSSSVFRPHADTMKTHKKKMKKTGSEEDEDDAAAAAAAALGGGNRGNTRAPPATHLNPRGGEKVNGTTTESARM